MIALVDNEVTLKDEIIKLIKLEVNCGSTRNPKITVKINYKGNILEKTESGNGPVDSIFNAINSMIKNDAKLELFQIHAVTKGTDAQAEVTVRLNEEGISVNGLASDTDTMVASANAYIVALNKLIDKRKRKTSGIAISSSTNTN